MSSDSDNPVVVGSLTRHGATCCLILLFCPAALLAYFFFSVWRSGHVNHERERTATASVGRQAARAYDSTAHALSATASNADPDDVTGLIWRYTKAPAISYDTTRRTYTALASWSAWYIDRGVVLNSGPIELRRCFAITVRNARGTWSTSMSRRGQEFCSSLTTLNTRVILAKRQIGNLTPEQLNPDEVSKALNLAGIRPSYLVRQVSRREGATSITVMVLDILDRSPTGDQCYRFTRPTAVDGGQRPVSAVPVTAC